LLGDIWTFSAASLYAAYPFPIILYIYFYTILFYCR